MVKLRFASSDLSLMIDDTIKERQIAGQTAPSRITELTHIMKSMALGYTELAILYLINI